MNAQAVIQGSRVTHIRELKAEIVSLKADNVELRSELACLRAHFDLAVLATADLKAGEHLEIWDGWNLILGSERVAATRQELIEQAKASRKHVWIVFDGHDENVSLNGNVRVSYTGGNGEHRADKFICDYVRMARYLGLAHLVSVRTNDKDFKRTIGRLQGSKCHA